MHNVMWLNNTVPVICGGAWTSKAGMLNNWRMDYKMLAAIDSEQGEIWQRAVEIYSKEVLMPPPQRLFWRTRLEPELVPWAHMEIFLPLLAVNMAPLSRWVERSNAKVLVSATSAEYTTL